MNVAVLHNEDGLLRHGTLLNHHAAEEIHWHEAILGKILCERSAQLLIPASIFARSSTLGRKMDNLSKPSDCSFASLSPFVFG